MPSYLQETEYTDCCLEIQSIGVSLSRAVGFLRGTSAVVVILVKGHAFPTIVKVRPVAVQEELNEFEHLEVWELVPRPDKVMVITLKWIYKVKLDELGGILKNKAHLVARS
ncbi:hypothetical protein Tco_0022144 [Tanacetum coccineum]